MNIDWNWFFSSFCQSAAALIGIIGAFIISRLLGLSEKINSTSSQLYNLIIESNKILANISNRNFEWYNRTIIKYDNQLKEAIQKGEFDNLSQEEILKKIYEADSRLFKNDVIVMESFNLLKNKYGVKTTKLEGGLSLNTAPMIADIPTAGLLDKLHKEKEIINQLEIESQTLIQYFEQNLHDLNSFEGTVKPLKIIIILLMISFPLTVIYPLHFMPVVSNQDLSLTFNPLLIIQSILSLKFLLLFIFFITIEGIFLYFLILINQLNTKLNTAKNENSDELRDIKNYSEYFDEY